MHKLEALQQALDGELHFDALVKSIYATDASVYRELPLAVAYPKHTNDIQKLIHFAKQYNTSLIPRAAGTSLAGQCVGDGIVVDVSRHFTRILDIDQQEQTATVQPGVIRDELNRYLEPFGLFFGPNTSTSNRCMIGGMVGNNSSGTTSIKYGVTRDKVLEMEVVLSDGSVVTFGEVTPEQFLLKAQQQDVEGDVYKFLYNELSQDEVQQEILNNFPDPEIHRRNTGYAVDELLKMRPFRDDGEHFNLCKLLAGSEGTLALTTKIKLKLDHLPPQHSVMVAAHFNSISECLKAVVPSMKHNLYTCEMMDKVVLDCTKNNSTQERNRFFVEGDPAAILMFEVRNNAIEACRDKASKLIDALHEEGLGYAFPVLEGAQINSALALRKAGLGLLGNMVGDRKAVACIEDTAVKIEDLANYIEDFTTLMAKHQQQAVYYAHAGAGELHLRPILDLKKSEDVKVFRKITEEVAVLVKKYNGSLSGEHGDGRVRAEFIPMMIGDKNYELLQQLKKAFDPQAIFNPGKIVDTAPMNNALRYEPDREEPTIITLFDFSDSEGMLRATEKCNGSGDCRKLPSANGGMCPSYHATREEKDTTRARANALREFLTNSDKPNPFDQEELKDVLDLCVSCKACASECPSNVDMATMKAEFLYQYHKSNPPSFRDTLFAKNTTYNKKAMRFSKLSNWLLSSKITSGIIKRSVGIANERQLPRISTISFYKDVQTIKGQYFNDYEKKKKLYFFLDEFTETLDVKIGLDAVALLSGLGYEVLVVDHVESGRSQISKGFLEEAKKLADQNVSHFKELISEDTPLIGIEPSAILTFRDEYLRLADDKHAARALAAHVFTIEEFLSQEIDDGNITSGPFTKDHKKVKLHVHCHQKALGNQADVFHALNLPENYTVTVIPSGCCGMAGSFGYEKEHYDVSMQMGEQTLFPAVRKASYDTIIAASGTSCRHQIKDGTNRKALHPVTILKQALR